MTTPQTNPGRLDGWLRRYVTQTTTAVGLVVGVSGGLLFFDLAKRQVHSLHEWLGMAFLAIAVLHVVRHRAGFAAMLRQPRQYVLFALAGAAMLAFVGASFTGDGRGGNPLHQLADRALDAPLVALAPVLGLAPDEAGRRLAAAGVVVDSPSQSLAALAAANRTDPRRLLGVVMGGRGE
ncbi:MAG: hypothetical protein RLZZ501_1628 [Pseudomonadota bacterium]|jgi:hypothetical protein